MLTKIRWTLVALAAVCATPVSLTAQGLETLGNRAAGLSAFVAVADDASAVVWNPGGLVMGPLFNISVDLGRSATVPGGPPANPSRAGRVSTTLIAIGVPPLGLSYYRIVSTRLDALSYEVPGNPRRQEGQLAVRSLVTSHLGATLLQSLGDHLTVGTTLKLVRGRLGSGSAAVADWDAGFERAERLDTRGSTKGDLDIGAMFAAGRTRAGLVVRNATQPTFDSGDSQDIEMTMARHARVGIAWGDRWPGLPRTVMAIDADLTRVPQAGGDRRDVAAGVERWLRGQQIGVRGGLRASTLGDPRPIVSGGLSLAVRSGTYVDAYLARGRRDDRAWGVAARLTY